MHNVGGLILIFVLVLGTVYVYNAFIAKPGQTIANLGQKTT